MIAIQEDNKTLEITRGDATQKEFNVLAFKFPIFNVETQQEEDYEFQLEDKISFIVFPKKGYMKEEILRKEYTVSELGYMSPTTIVELPLTSEETKLFPLSNKKQTYWYDLVLNDEVTMIGMEEDGATKIIVYPEAGE